MSSSKKESKKNNMTLIVIVLIVAFLAILGGIWYFSYKTITNPGIQQTAGAALPLLFAA